MGGPRSCDEGGGWHPALESTQGDGWAEFEEFMFCSSVGERHFRGKNLQSASLHCLRNMQRGRPVLILCHI